MVPRAPRVLLALASLLSAFGGAIHAAAFPRASAAVASSNLPSFFGGSLKGLWLGDAATLFILAAVFALLAVRPGLSSRPVVMLVALIPAATAILIYVFLGGFLAGHLLLAIAALAFTAGAIDEFPRVV